MKLGTRGRYAVMAMVDLARCGGSRPMPLSDIADRQEISLSYLEQLFGHLRKGGLIKSVRGPGGGYLLSRDADDISISDIVMSVDEPLTVTRCRSNSSIGCLSDKSRCLTHDLWEELGIQVYLYLKSVSLADVCHRRIRKSRLPRPLETEQERKENNVNEEEGVNGNGSGIGSRSRLKTDTPSKLGVPDEVV